jgi:hypothetical protein
LKDTDKEVRRLAGDALKLIDPEAGTAIRPYRLSLCTYTAVASRQAGGRLAPVVEEVLARSSRE